MPKRLYGILCNNQSSIIYDLVKTFSSISKTRNIEVPFERKYRYSSLILEGYLELMGFSNTGKLENLFIHFSEEWAGYGFNIEDLEKVFNKLKDSCIPFVEKRYSGNPHTRSRLKLDLESCLRTTVTLFASIYHALLVHLNKEEVNVFERIFKETSDSIFLLDPERRIKLINPAMEEFLGKSMAETSGKFCCEIFNWKDKKEHCNDDCPVSKAVANGENSAYYEGLIEISRFNRKWIGTTASFVRDKNGKINEIIMVMRDISLLKEIVGKMENEIKTFETLADSTSGIELKIPCMSEFAITVRSQAELIAKRMKFCKDRIQDIKSAVGEACDNAIEHGSSNKGVDIRYRINGPNLLIEIEDYGEGFDPESIGNDLPSPFTEGGRGLYLIRNLVDSVEITSKKGYGTKIIMEVYRRPEVARRWKKDDNWSKDKRSMVM